MRYDTIVVGAGLAGLTAALRLSGQGQRVLVVARGAGATHLAPATIDVLGYVGVTRVENPAASLAALLASAPEHPYRHLGPDQLAAALTWFGTHASALGYTGRIDENKLLPTALGVAKPAAFVPSTMSGGDLRAGGRFVFVGFKGFKDFHPALLAANIAHANLASPVTARGLVLEAPPSQRADLSGRVLAGRFDDGELTGWLVNALHQRVEPDERIGVPAVLGLRNANRTWQELETKLGRTVFEVSTLPPSIPGRRLFEALSKQLREAGTRVVLDVNAVGAHVTDGRIDAVDVANATGRVSHTTGAVVLASGGFASGGLELDSFGTTRETAFGLPLIGVPESEHVRFAPGYFDDQPLARAGVATDDLFRPVDAGGHPVYPNLHAAGAILGGAIPWKEQSGTGISLATGYAAAEAILTQAAQPLSEAVR